MNEPEKYTDEIPVALDTQRVDRVVSLITNVSRNAAIELLVAGNVLVDGSSVSKASFKVRTGQKIEITVPYVDTELKADSSVVVPVIYEDSHVLVVDKPAQLVVHPGSGVKEGTMVQGLLAQHPEIITVGASSRPGIVHRLDRGTSGLLAVAKTQESYDSLTQQLSERSVGRFYDAVVDGVVSTDAGTIDAPLGRSLRDRTKQAVVSAGKTARTHYEYVGTVGETMSRLKCRLETGRTHQIRVHLASIGHPVVGDLKYGGSKQKKLERFFLHAAFLSFVHPHSGKEIEFSSPLPIDLQNFLDAHH